MSEPIPKHYPNKRQKPTRKTANRNSSAKTRKARAIRRQELRVECVERAGGSCEWSDCHVNGEHMAHIEGLGKGGEDTIDNVMFLCVYHHDLLDGRTMMRQREVAYLLHEINQLRSGER